MLTQVITYSFCTNALKTTNSQSCCRRCMHLIWLSYRTDVRRGHPEHGGFKVLPNLLKSLNNGRLVFCEPKLFCNNVWGNLSYPLTFQQAKTLIFIRFLHSAKKYFDNTNFLTKLRHEKCLTLFDTKILLLYEIPFVYDCVKNVLAHHEMNVQ